MNEGNLHRRTFLKRAVALGCGALVGPGHLLHGLTVVAGAAREFDLVIEGGMVIDGSGKAPFAADVGIAGRKIAAIGKLNEVKAKVRINAQGLAVAPGFIDTHAHTNLIRNPKAQRQFISPASQERQGEGSAEIDKRVFQLQPLGRLPQKHTPCHEPGIARRVWDDSGVGSG